MRGIQEVAVVATQPSCSSSSRGARLGQQLTVTSGNGCADRVTGRWSSAGGPCVTCSQRRGPEAGKTHHEDHTAWVNAEAVVNTVGSSRGSGGLSGTRSRGQTRRHRRRPWSGRKRLRSPRPVAAGSPATEVGDERLLRGRGDPARRQPGRRPAGRGLHRGGGETDQEDSEQGVGLIGHREAGSVPRTGRRRAAASGPGGRRRAARPRASSQPPRGRQLVVPAAGRGVSEEPAPRAPPLPRRRPEALLPVASASTHGRRDGLAEHPVHAGRDHGGRSQSRVYGKPACPSAAQPRSPPRRRGRRRRRAATRAGSGRHGAQVHGQAGPLELVPDRDAVRAERVGRPVAVEVGHRLPVGGEVLGQPPVALAGPAVHHALGGAQRLGAQVPGGLGVGPASASAAASAASTPCMLALTPR